MRQRLVRIVSWHLLAIAFTVAWPLFRTFAQEGAADPDPHKELKLTVTVEDKDGKRSVSAKQDGVAGGVNHFVLTVTGTLPEGEKIVLQLQRVAGSTGSATFVDTGNATMEVTATTDPVKVRGGAVSDKEENMEIQAFLKGVLCDSEKFTVFWLDPTHAYDQDTDTVPDAAQNSAGGKLKDILMSRVSNAKLGFEEAWDLKDIKRKLFGKILMRMLVEPVGIKQGDLKDGGPSNGFKIRRIVTGRRCYLDGCAFSELGNYDNAQDDSMPALMDLIANKEDDSKPELYIYDLDTPTHPREVPGHFPVEDDNEHYLRMRTNFEQWAEYVDDDGTPVRCSDKYPWYFRASWHQVAQNDIRAEGATGDNQVKKNATTKLTYDLNDTSSPPDFSITGLEYDDTKNHNRNDNFDLDIQGTFPAVDGCEYRVQLFYTPGDPYSEYIPDTIIDVQQPQDSDTAVAESVTRAGDGSKLTANFDLTKFKPPAPVPARANYKVQVFYGEKLEETSPFPVTEPDLDKWTIVGGVPLTGKLVLVTRADGTDGKQNTIPGIKPTVTKHAGTAMINTIKIVFRYGFFNAVVEVAGTGTLTLKVEGGGKTAITPEYEVVAEP